MPEAIRSLSMMLVVKSSEPMASRQAPRTASKSAKSGSIAVIPVYGKIVQRVRDLGWFEGGTSTPQISAALADANNDDSVSQILLNIDSPGGSVYGVQKLADEMRTSKKPVIAFANSLAASAAFWIASAASELT